jgi:tricorn protease
MGNDDVWVTSVDGAAPRPLTFHSTDDQVQYWTPDGKGVVITSSRGPSPWGSPFYIVPLDGGRPMPMPMDRAAAGMISQDGTKVAFNRLGFRYWRKHYRGNNNTDIWVQDLASKKIRQLTDQNVKQFRKHTQDAHPMWGADGQIYFMSERDGIFNIWKISPEGGKPSQVTSHKTDGVQYPSISPDGKTIVYENEFELWRLSVEGGNPQKIPIDLSFDPKDNLVEIVETDSETSDFAVPPDGEHVAVGYHGEIFLVPTDPETGEKTRVTHSAWRDQDMVYSPDGKTIAYMSDQSGEEEIWLYDVATAKHRQLTELESLKGDLTWSPDSTQMLFTSDSKIHLVDIEGGKITELIHNPEGGFQSVEFSRDGKWLVYSRSNRDLNSEVYLFNIASRQEYNVTDSRFTEFGNTLTPDGKHVVFVSNRSGNYQVYAVSLAKMSEDPDDPLNKKKRKRKSPERGKETPTDDNDSQPPRDKQDGDGEKQDDEQEEEKSEQADDEAEKEDDDKDKKPEEKPLTIDLDGIRDRARQLTSGSEDIRRVLVSPDGKTVYYTRANGLYAISIEGGKEKKISDGSFSSLTLTADGQSFFFRSGSNIHKMAARGGEKKKIEFKLSFKVDHVAEWEQVFEEAWRVMKYRFYDENMHGFDWVAIKQRYKPMLKYVGENQDLYDLCNEMIGELNASHTGVSGPPSRTMESLQSTRHLGFELEVDGDYFRVSHIYPKGPADKEWLDLKVGDIVLAIEGQPIRSGDNEFRMLNELLNDYVDLTVCTPGKAADQDSVALGPERQLRLRHVSSVSNLQYEAWVEANRRFVDEQSGGKIGYVHIRSMNQSSLERFETEIDQFWNKNGMIIDIRYNGGGNIDQQLIDILERKPYEYWNSRGGGRAWGRRPRQAIAGPKVMLINWRSASDSEVTPQAFRDLKLGRIVGNPTYGAVIATGSYRLLNGARIRTPGALVVTYDPKKPNNYGINLENFGVPPDVWVENTPEDELAGFDRVLKAAVDEALSMLAKGDWQFGEDD